MTRPDILPTVEQLIQPIALMIDPWSFSDPKAIGARERTLKTILSFAKANSSAAGLGGRPPSIPDDLLGYYNAWKDACKTHKFIQIAPKGEPGLRINGTHYQGLIRRVCKTGDEFWVVQARINSPLPSDSVKTYALARLMSTRFLKPYRRCALVLHSDGQYERIEYHDDTMDRFALEKCIDLYRWGVDTGRIQVKTPDSPNYEHPEFFANA